MMIDLDRQPIDLNCPACGFRNQVSFKQIRLRDTIICRGCKVNIRLDDYMNECRNARKNIDRALRELESTLEKLSNMTITIKF